MSIRTLALLTTALASLALAAPVSSAAGHSALASTLAKTSIVLVRPVDSAGHVKPGYRITQQLGHGQCNAGSDATDDAYRCFSGNSIVDPCWVTSRRSYVVCVIDNDPRSRRLLELHVTKGYDNENGGHGGVGSRATDPWGVTLSSGKHCHDLEGAHGFTHGKVISYACAHTSKVLIGEVNKHHAVWRIQEARYVGHGHYKPGALHSIATATFGARSRKG